MTESNDISDIVIDQLVKTYPEYYSEIHAWFAKEKGKSDKIWTIAESVTVYDIMQAILNGDSIEKVKRIL